MAKVAERLIILREHNDALLQRLYNIRKTLTDPLLKPNIFKDPNATKKLFAQLLKDAPFCGENIESVQGYELLGNNLTAQLEVFLPMYNTFREILDWSEHAQKTLEELTNATNVEFDYEINLLTITDFFSVMVGFAKLFLLMNRIEERKLLLTIFNVLFTKVNGQAEPNVQKVYKMLTDYDKPYVKLQEVFFAIQNHVGKALQNLVTVYEKGNLTYLTQKRPLEMLSEPDRIPYPAVEDTYVHLAIHEEVTEFIGFGYFCCPEAAGFTFTKVPTTGSPVSSLTSRKTDQKKKADDRMWNVLLGKVLQSNFLLPLYGDEMLLIHEPYQFLTKNYKTPSLNLKKEKNSLKAFEELAAQNAAALHKDKRNYLRMQLKTLIRMMRDCPGLLGPKFQLVLATLALSRHEILWYFRHLEFQTKKYRDVDETHIAEIVHLVDEMSSLCLKHREVISKYHKQILARLYHKRVGQLLDLTKSRFEGGYVLSIMESIVKDLASADSFHAMRLNWKRAEAFLSGYQFKNSMQDPNCRSMFITMQKVYQLSRNVDEIEVQLVEKGSLKELYFYSKQLETVFNDTLRGNRSQPLYTMAFVRNLNSYADNISKNLNPEMRKKIGKNSVEIGESYIQAVVNHIRTGIDQLRGQPNGFQQLANQIGGDKVADRLKARMLSKNQTNSPSNAGTPIQRPGFESYYGSRSLIEGMSANERNLTYLLFSVGSSEEIPVYDTAFYPTEYLRDNLQQYVSQHVQNILLQKPPITKESKNDHKFQEFRPPSLILYELETFAQALKVVEQCININVDDLLRNALLDQLVHPNYVESPFVSGNVVDSSQDNSAIMVYARWYADLVANANSKYKLFYSPNRRTFISTPMTPINAFRVEEYLDTQELRALTKLIGPYGVRVLDQLLLDSVYTNSEKLRDVLSQHVKTLKEQEQLLFSENALDKEMGKKYAGLENMLGYTITLGGIMEFRKRLHEALEVSVLESIPVIYNVVDSAHKQYGGVNVFRDERLLPVDALATDCGMKQPSSDYALKKKLEPLAETSSLWDIMPISFAVMLTLPKAWKDSDYNVNLEGWTNNTHLAITCFHELIIALHSIKGKDVAAIEREYYKFAETSAMLLLNMRLAKGYEKQVNSTYIFADRLIKSAPYLNTSVFEELSPYAITRSIYVTSYEPHQKLNQLTSNVTQEQQNMEV
jgi:NCK-associated protein 1